MSELERRYRSLLRLLPASYRAVWEEEMVAAFLESMDSADPEEAEFRADYGRPSWSEVGSVAALAIRLRVGTGAAPRRYLAWGGAIRLFALAGLLVHAVLGVVDIGFQLWVTGRVPFLPTPPREWTVGGSIDFWHVLWHVAGFGWLAAFLALLLGNPGVARVLALLAALPALGFTVAATVQGEPLGITRWSNLLLDVLVLVALTTFHREAPPVRARPWLGALAAGTVLMSLPVLMPAEPPQWLPLLDWPALCCAALLIAAAVHLSAPLFARERPPVWSHALALLAVAVLGLRLASLLDYVQLSSSPGASRAVLAGLIEALAVAAVGVRLSMLAARALRGLPTAPTGSTAWSAPHR